MSITKFAQIKQFIVDNIRSGQWQENDRVPSENELTNQFKVSRMTARRALSELTDVRKAESALLKEPKPLIFA